MLPTAAPSKLPTSMPSLLPTSQPSQAPTTTPSRHPTDLPTSQPSNLPSLLPSSQPTHIPTTLPTPTPTTQGIPPYSFAVFTYGAGAISQQNASVFAPYPDAALNIKYNSGNVFTKLDFTAPADGICHFTYYMRPDDLNLPVAVSPQIATVGSGGVYTNLWGDVDPSLYAWLAAATGTPRKGISYSVDLSMNGGDKFRIMAATQNQLMKFQNLGGTWLGSDPVGFSSRFTGQYPCITDTSMFLLATGVVTEYEVSRKVAGRCR